jgi:hypothetical protein
MKLVKEKKLNNEYEIISKHTSNCKLDCLSKVGGIKVLNVFKALKTFEI